MTVSVDKIDVQANTEMTSVDMADVAKIEMTGHTSSKLDFIWSHQSDGQMKNLT